MYLRKVIDEEVATIRTTNRTSNACQGKRGRVGGQSWPYFCLGHETICRIWDISSLTEDNLVVLTVLMRVSKVMSDERRHGAGTDEAHGSWPRQEVVARHKPCHPRPILSKDKSILRYLSHWRQWWRVTRRHLTCAHEEYAGCWALLGILKSSVLRRLKLSGWSITCIVWPFNPQT